MKWIRSSKDKEIQRLQQQVKELQQALEARDRAAAALRDRIEYMEERLDWERKLNDR